MKLYNEHTITIGLFDKDSHNQEIEKAKAVQMVEDEICKRGFCATLITEGVFGIYRHEDGTVVREPSIRIEIAGRERDEILPMVNVFRVMFNQESILYKMTSQEVDLVFAEEAE